MTRNKRLILPLVLLFLALPIHFARAVDRPNVLLIISDDLNCRLGCYGAAEAKTPNLDRLAARGVRFDRAYCNYPVCNVSRTSFLSGRYPEVTGVLDNATDPRIRLGQEFQFLPEYFRAQCWFTAGCGKIAHGAFSNTLSWDYYSEPARRGDNEDSPAATTKRKPRKKSVPKTNVAARHVEGPPVPFGWQATTNADEQEPDGQVARRLLKFFSEKRDQPFFIAAGFHKPHVPHTAPRKYFDLHDPATMPTPPEPADHEKDIPPIANSPKYDSTLTIEQRRAIIQHYYAATSFMDAQVGLLFDEMDRLKLWDSTVVIFMSDHGWHLGEHGGFWAKSSIMDESARAPLIVAAPGIRAGSSTTALVEYVDLFPTLVELCGIALPSGQQGTSFVPVLNDPRKPGKESVYTVVTRRNSNRDLGRALHTASFTYLEWPDGSQQLYNAVTDPHEYVNLARDPRYAETLAKMKHQLAARRAAIAP